KFDYAFLSAGSAIRSSTRSRGGPRRVAALRRSRWLPLPQADRAARWLGAWADRLQGLSPPCSAIGEASSCSGALLCLRARPEAAGACPGARRRLSRSDRGPHAEEHARRLVGKGGQLPFEPWIKAPRDEEDI